MKVALINPMAKGMKVTAEPLHLGYIAGCLEKNGIAVKIIDQMAGDDIMKEIKAYQPEMVGISGLSLSSMTPIMVETYKIADMCRSMGILTVMGGPHPSALPEEALGHVDIVIVGEEVTAMWDIINEGITSGIVSRPYLKNIDELPLPSWHLMKLEFYLNTVNEIKTGILTFLGPAIFSTRSASLITSRGCPFRCIFCPNSLKQTPVRFHSAERVMSEIRHLKAAYDVQAVSFLDENFLMDKLRLEEICEKIIKEELGILWGCATSAHFVDYKTARMIYKAGCRQIIIGFESGSQRILDVLNKSVTVEQNKEAIKTCNDAGLLVHGSFVIGSPTETFEDVRLTQKFILETELENYRVNIATPYPGTKLWELCSGQLPRPFNWRSFYHGKLKVYPYTTFSKKELGRLFLETALIKPLVSKRDWKSALRYPRESLRWLFRHPITAAKIISGTYVIKRNRDETIKKARMSMLKGLK